MIAGVDPGVDLADQGMALATTTRSLAARNPATNSAPAGSASGAGARGGSRRSAGIRSGVEDDPVTAVRDSGAVVEVLAVHAAGARTAAARDRGAAYLAALAPIDVDSRARRRSALAAAGALPPGELPVAGSNPDGGLGLGREYASTIMDSALAALAAGATGDLDDRPDLIEFLLGAQRGDGGWAYLPGARARSSQLRGSCARSRSSESRARYPGRFADERAWRGIAVARRGMAMRERAPGPARDPRRASRPRRRALSAALAPR